MKKDTLTAEKARRLLDYNPTTGEFLWKHQPDKRPQWNGQYAGKVAGKDSTRGYRQIKVDGRFYGAHRLAWLTTYGEWPSDHIDHINRITSDNRIENLRAVSCSVNCQNKVRPVRIDHRSSKYLGVAWHHKCKKWQAQISHAGRNLYLGLFAHEEDASMAYLAAKERLHEGYAP